MFVVLPILPVLFVLLLSPPVLSQTGPGVPCICLEEFSEPPSTTVTGIANANDGSGRLFSVEQRGFIWTWRNGTRDPEPFADLTGTIHLRPGETGLMDVAFHPNHAQNGLLYVFATVNESDANIWSGIIEYKVSDTNPNLVDLTSERFVFGHSCGNYFGYVCQHFGNIVVFGPDNLLYVGFGDGGGQGDPLENGQNKTSYDGSIHRIDVDSRSGDLEYGIPPDNPFLADPEAVPELYAFGVRQPWTMVMDTGDRNTGYGYGRMFFADVGQDQWEEINMLEKGGNFGWSAYEGPDCFKPELCDTIGPHIPPIAAYGRSDGISIMPGAMYRGTMNPDLNGWYLYSDWGSGNFFGTYETGPDVWAWQQIDVCATCPVGLTNIYTEVSALGADEYGEQYVATAVAAYDPVTEHGAIYRIRDPNTYQP